MIAIDTKVLLCYLLQDDHGQAFNANKLMLEAKDVLVTDVALTETV